MHWLVIALLILSVISGFALHGKEREDTTYDAKDSIIGALIWFILLYFGGFWG